VPYIGLAAEFQAVKLIDVPEKAENMTCDLTLDPGLTRTGIVRSPEGKPLTGVTVTGLTSQDFNSTEPLKGADFIVTGLTAKQPRLVTFYYPEQQLGKAILLRGDEVGPLNVVLEKCGTVTGLLVDADRTPRAAIRIWGHPSLRNQAEGRGRDAWATTDKEGRFRIEGSIPGLPYRLITHEDPANRFGQTLSRELTVQPGQTEDLGDVPPVPMK
jgi:hypothetical protein